jgi:hypothetical protein
MLIKAFQIVLVVLVALFTLVGLIMLFAALESTLVTGIGSFAFAVSRRVFRIFLMSTMLLVSTAAAVLVWKIRRRQR